MLQTIISPPIFSKFEHGIGSGGGSGGSGGFFAILRVEFLFGLALQNHETPS